MNKMNVLGVFFLVLLSLGAVVVMADVNGLGSGDLVGFVNGAFSGVLSVGSLSVSGSTSLGSVSGDDGVFSGDVNATNINAVNGNFDLIGNSNYLINPSTQNSIGVRRPLSTVADTYVYVNPSGTEDYTTIQDALNDIPYFINHNYTIYIRAGDYDEDIIVPPVIIGDTIHGNEGAVGYPEIRGSAMNDVIVNSILVIGSNGAISPSINRMTVDSVEPTSDENTCIAVYGSKHPQFTYINITGVCSYGIMAYASSIQVTASVFNDQTYGVLLKRDGTALLGDLPVGTENYGSVVNEFVWASAGRAELVKNNVTSNTGKTIVRCDVGKGGFMTSGNGTIYCVTTFPEDTYFEKQIGMGTYSPNGRFHLLEDGSNTYGFNLENDGVNFAQFLNQDGVLAGGRSAFYLLNDGVDQTSGDALMRIRNTRAGTTIPNVLISNSAGTGDALKIDSTSGSGADIRLVPRTSPPSTTNEGSIYFDNDLNKPCYYNSTSWVTFDGVSICS